MDSRYENRLQFGCGGASDSCCCSDGCDGGGVVAGSACVYRTDAPAPAPCCCGADCGDGGGVVAGSVYVHGSVTASAESGVCVV